MFSVSNTCFLNYIMVYLYQRNTEEYNKFIHLRITI